MKTITFTAIKGSFSLMDPHPTEGVLTLALVAHGLTATLEVDDAVFKRIEPVLNDFQKRKMITWAEVHQHRATKLKDVELTTEPSVGESKLPDPTATPTSTKIIKNK